MEIQAFGYLGLGASNLDDWAAFATATIGMQSVDRASSMRAFRMDDRKQRLFIDRAADARDGFSAGDDDRGPNTGGMGAYSPPAGFPDNVLEIVREAVIAPTLRGLLAEDESYRGVLYIGLMWTASGPRVVEFNARFGDPAIEVVLELLASPLAPLLSAAATGVLAAHPPLEWRDGSAVTVVIASEGYPESPRSGRPITGIADADALPEVTVLHAGTKSDADGAVLSAGGRVLAVTATGRDLTHARDRAYAGVALIHLDGAHSRTDIALAASQTTASAGTLGP